MRKAFYLFLALIAFVLLSLSAFADSPREVVIEESELTIDLAVSDTYHLTAYVLPESADQSLNWYSAKYSTLSVEDGVLTAHRTGRITITANIPGNGKIKDHCVVTIIDSRIPTAVEVTSDDTILEPTGSMQMHASVLPPLANQEVIWASLDERIATVDENGLVTAKREGEVYIRAYSKENRDVRGQVKLTVRYLSAPASVSVPESSLTMDVGSTYALPVSVFPSDASRIVHFSSSDPSIASVSETGVISFLSYGTCEIAVKSAVDPSVSANITVCVLDERVPEAIIAYPSSLHMAPSNVREISLLVLPESLNADLIWRSTDEKVAVVDQNGRVKALDDGTSKIICESAYAKSVACVIPVTVEYGKTPTSISFLTETVTVRRGESARVEIVKTPSDAGNAISIEYSNPGIAEMDECGNIVALRRGETAVRLTSVRNPEVFADLTIIVEDEKAPLSVSSDLPLKHVLRAGQTIAPSITFTPENCESGYVWTSSNPEIAYADENGVIHAVSPGLSIIRAQNTYAPEIHLDFSVTVDSDEYTLVMPERRTDTEALDENMQKIESVRLSAQKMLLKDYENGKMNRKEYERRKKVVDSAFEMYAFPWMVEHVQKYWMDANSENGLKDFKPGIMYYGLPYISGGSSARTFTSANAVESKWYLPASDGDYYIFNRNHPEYDGMYAGNDCSSFISLAYFGNAVHNGEIVKTYTLYYDERFRTTDDPPSLKAGDIMVRHSIHVIMFLYWADEAHTQAVFIEQGGDEKGINTISTSIYNIDDYFNNFYHIRSLRY